MSDDEEKRRKLKYVTIRKFWQEPNRRKRNQIIKDGIDEAYYYGKISKDNLNA